MEVLREKVNAYFYNYYFLEDNKKLGITYYDNGDLYFIPFTQEDQIDFLITKDNMVIYNLFYELYESFKEAKVFKESEEELLNKVNLENQRLKNSKLYNSVFVNEKIIWISDDSLSSSYDESNALTISKEEDLFRLTFTYHDSKKPYLKSIRIRNARSRYKPFNLLMMNFFSKLQEYDPDMHQIHMEECITMSLTKK